MIAIIKNKGNKSEKHIKDVQHFENYTSCGNGIVEFIKICTAKETHHVNLKQNTVEITMQ